MNKQLTLGSLFDGSGGFPLGAVLNGVIPVWASEIEPFPIRVTTKRLPFMKHYGDICTINGGEIEPVDIITFGSPCTDMSVAGKRAGLIGKQSVLFYEAIRIIEEMRCKTNGQKPRYIVWENVPGAFSSNNGKDFKAVLEAVIGVVYKETAVPSPKDNKWPYADCYMGDGWSVAYRTLDAQYWGVPQRRKRIYLVADFGGAGAPEILFKSEGLSGYPSQGLLPWQRTAGAVEDCTRETGNLTVLNDQGGKQMGVTQNITATLRAKEHGHQPLVFEPGAVSRIGGHAWSDASGTLRADMGDNQIAVAIENHPTDSRIKIDGSGSVQTLTSRMGTGGGNVPLVMGERLKGLPISENLAQTLLGTDYKGVQCVCEHIPVTLKIRSGCEGGGKGSLVHEDKSATLSFNNDQTVFVPKAYGICSDKSNSMLSDNPYSGIYEADTTRTIDQSGGNPSCNQGGIAIVDPIALSQHKRDISDAEYTIRRLTPTECARLQGFPFDWCADLGTPNPTDAEIEWWKSIFETHRKITGTSSKPKTDKQIIKWLQDPHNDGAEYMLWGNGVALPCVCFVLAGIMWASQSDINI